MSPALSWLLIIVVGALIVIGVVLADRFNQRQLEQARLDLGALEVQTTAERLAAWKLDDVDGCWADRQDRAA